MLKTKEKHPCATPTLRILQGRPQDKYAPTMYSLLLLIPSFFYEPSALFLTSSLHTPYNP
jgi:hypothetical protein